MIGKKARSFYEEVLPVLRADRPQIVFDMSKMRHVDSIGAAVLLRCIAQAMKSDGDIKLAGVLPQAAVVFELTRIGQMFETYDSSIAAMFSYNSPSHHGRDFFSSHATQLEAMVSNLDAFAEDDLVDAQLAAQATTR
jgi:anti-anti-sigma factor